ncbi:MAG: hypothetical protein ACXVTC_26415 [Solirubrobacteraceae bacterium]
MSSDPAPISAAIRVASVNGSCAASRSPAGCIAPTFSQRRRAQDIVSGNASDSGAGCLRGADARPGAGSPRRAVRFLRRHRGKVGLLTIDICGNDIGAACGTGLAVTVECARSALVTTGANVAKIAHELRAAAGRHTPIAAMNYYDPGLALWLQPSSRALVPRTVSIVDSLNRTLARAYRSGSAEIAVADVATAFATHDLRHKTGLGRHGRVPVAVANICRYTGACLSPQDNHGTALGWLVNPRQPDDPSEQAKTGLPTGGPE